VRKRLRMRLAKGKRSGLSSLAVRRPSPARMTVRMERESRSALVSRRSSESTAGLISWASIDQKDRSVEGGFDMVCHFRAGLWRWPSGCAARETLERGRPVRGRSRLGKPGVGSARRRSRRATGLVVRRAGARRRFCRCRDRRWPERSRLRRLAVGCASRSSRWPGRPEGRGGICVEKD